MLNICNEFPLLSIRRVLLKLLSAFTVTKARCWGSCKINR